LVLVLSIDQMRFDYLTRFNSLYKGGLRRLLDQGAVFTSAKYRHANTETGPGHSVILSGRHASHSGIVANTWYDPLLKKSINVVDDPVQQPVGGKGRGASPTNFIGFTVGDVLKRDSPQSKVVGVSMKDRSAILMAGRRADAAYWFENEGGNFITSTYYMATAPEWLNQWNARKYADQYSGKLWERLLPDEKVYEKYAGPDAVEGEWDRKDITFPHRIRQAPPLKGYYEDFRRTPFADEMVLQAALEAMKAHRLGEDAVTDILAVGFSATDVIGHTYGAESHEAMDQLLRLDQTLQKLFEEVDRRVGLAQTWVVLSADHASMPLVELAQKQGLRILIESHSTRSEAAGDEMDGPTLAKMFRAEARAADAIQKNPEKFAHYIVEEAGGMIGLKDLKLARILNAPPTPYTRERFDDNYNWTLGWGLVPPGATYENTVDNRAWQ
jgi:predicted AlkP superfamily pyrophosphatase or phosphodiesterase